MKLKKIGHALQPAPSFKDKARLSFMVGFAISFTFLLFGMLDIFLNNHEYLQVPFFTLLFVSLAAFLVTGLVIAGILMLCPGKLFPLGVSIAMGFLLAGYLQGTFFNLMIDLGKLTGDAIPWDSNPKRTLLNMLLWAVFLVLPLMVCLFKHQIWWRVTTIICILVVGMQSVALMAGLLTFDGYATGETKYYLSTEGELEISSQDNILVFVVDRLDYAYVEDVRAAEPDFFDRMDGFTEFTDTLAVYENTFPSATFLITGIEYDFAQPRKEYFTKAWENSSFIQLLKENNYLTKYHIDYGYVYSDINQLIGKADNLKYGVSSRVNLYSVTRKMSQLSAYRHAPYILKPIFWMPTVEFGTISDIVTNNDVLFFEQLKKKGLSVQNEKNNYLYLHLNGSHAPYTMDENGDKAEETDPVRQTMGVFKILYHYMEQMKEKGLYEDATIVVMGDHGWDTPQIGFFVKPKGIAGTPLVQNNTPVSIDNFLPTIMQSAGFDYSSYGVSVFDTDFNQSRRLVRYDPSEERVFFYWIDKNKDPKDSANWIVEHKQEFRFDSNGLPVEN